MSADRGETAVRAVAIRSILGWAHSFTIRHSNEGYELSDPDGDGAVFCRDWPQVERVLIRLEVPPHKIEEIKELLWPGTDIVVRRKIGY
ncbi:hypothetical protein [Edaphobacter bradus]|uniref:hypothetical protein n=1 Tax=Edaphobacter bradus TaxID=2259016 RepID=UPI0021E07934|nr:hypothetical protein [Edaphobacter bradus]